jgi:hypothetical protein
MQFGCIPLCSCVCSWFAGKDLAFLVRSTMQRRSITRGVVVLRLQCSEPSCSEAGSNCVMTPPNRELSEPFRRSGILVHITRWLRNSFTKSVKGLRWQSSRRTRQTKLERRLLLGLRRLELESRAWLTIRVGKRGGRTRGYLWGARRVFQANQDVGAEVDSIVESYSVTSKRKRTAPTSGPQTSGRQGKGQGCGRLRSIGPAQFVTLESEKLGCRLMRPSGPAKEGQQWAFGPEEGHFLFLFYF